MHDEERILPKYILGRVSVITVISSYLEFKGYSTVLSFRISLRWLIHIINSVDKAKLSCNSHRRSTTVSLETYPLYMIELFATEVDLPDTNQQRGRVSTQTPHEIDHVYLDRLFLLSNLTWRRAHVKAGWTGMDPNVKIGIYGDCNAMLLFSYISENKSRLLFYFWHTFARRVLV